MKDVQFITVVDSIEVSSITEITGAVPRTLRLQCLGGFNLAQEICINDVRMTSFVRVSDRVMLVYPSSALDEVVVGDMEVSVLAGTFTGTRPCTLNFGPTRNIRTTSGLQKLVQQVVKSLLTTIGSNKFAPQEGGDLVQGLGSVSNDMAALTALVANAVSSVEGQYVSTQNASSRLPATERLLSLEMLSVDLNPGTGMAKATIKLTTMAGRNFSFPLGL